MANMKRLDLLMLFSSAFVLMFTGGTGKPKIDWESEIIRYYNRYAVEYGGNETDKVLKDNYVEGFVWISPNSIIQGDFDDLKMHIERRETLGHWEDGPPRIVSTCGNNALTWATIDFTDDDTLREQGLIIIFYEYVDRMAKIKLAQFVNA